MFNEEQEKIYQEKAKRFEKFTNELAKLSKKYGVLLNVTGGVHILNIEDKKDLVSIEYDCDPSSGDLINYTNFK